MDEQGLESTWLFPTLGVGVEVALRHDVPACAAAFRAFNRWLEEDWGFAYQERIFAAPYFTLVDLDAAVAELEWCLAHDARIICMLPTPVDRPGESRSPVLEEFDPFWARVNDAGITVAFHSGDAGYGRFVDLWESHVAAIDAALTGQSSFDGIYYRLADAAVKPGTVQRPTPPIVLGAVGPSMLRLTAEVADVWSAFGGMAIASEDEFFTVLDRQNEVLDRHCDEIGRDPGTLRRSLLAVRPLAPWRSRESFERLADRAHHLGFGELILYMPSGSQERKVFDEVMADVLPARRAV